MSTVTIKYQTEHVGAPSTIIRTYYGEYYSLHSKDLPDMAIEGYIFQGWSLTQENPLILSPGVRITDSEITLYAIWKAIPKQLMFLTGFNLNEKIPFTSGTIYYDAATHELWFDDPLNSISIHKKIIDMDTFTYTIDEDMPFPFYTSTLAEGIIGDMILGA